MTARCALYISYSTRILLRLRPLYFARIPPLFHANFGVFPLHQIAHVGVSERMGLKLFGREIIFEEFQPMWSRYLIVTDRRTDRRTACNLITALCVASRGNKSAYNRLKLSQTHVSDSSVISLVIIISVRRASHIRCQNNLRAVFVPSRSPSFVTMTTVRRTSLPPLISRQPVRASRNFRSALPTGIRYTWRPACQCIPYSERNSSAVFLPIRRKRE